MDDDCDICECSHVYDEHLPGGKECDVLGCKCILFTPDPNAPNGLNDIEGDE